MANTTNQPLPMGWGVTVGLTPITVLPANPSRTALVFVNASQGISIAFCPAVVNIGSGGFFSGAQAGVPAINAPGSITMQPGDKFIVDTLNCTTQWNGIASGAGGALTILES